MLLTKIGKLMLIMVVLGHIAAGVGCSDDGKGGGATSASKASASTVLKIAWVPGEDNDVRRKEYEGIIKHLEQQLGKKVEVFQGTDYTAIIEAMTSKHIDVAVYGPFSYILAVDKANAEAFAGGVRADGTSTYSSYIIANKSSGIKTLGDLKGKEFAFVDPASTSGHLIPRTVLVKANIDPEKDLKKTVFAGGHDAVGLSVKNNKVPAGAISSNTYDKMVKEKVLNPDELVIVAKSDPIPGSPVAYRRDLSEDLKTNIKAAFLSVPKEAMPPTGGFVRYGEIKDREYNVIRDTAKILNLDLSKLD
jgi:phosphonate transport system substrate-binding protein